MTDSDVDTSRSVVKTYVPAYQKRIWIEHADDLGMSQSEFLSTMVQAGRRGFDPCGIDRSPEPTSDTATSSNGDADLKGRVEEILEGSGPLSWEEIVAALTDDIERRLEDALQELQSENRVSYSGRGGGYTLNGEEP
jgi:hypothetical protein